MKVSTIQVRWLSRRHLPYSPWARGGGPAPPPRSRLLGTILFIRVSSIRKMMFPSIKLIQTMCFCHLFKIKWKIYDSGFYIFIRAVAVAFSDYKSILYIKIHFKVRWIWWCKAFCNLKNNFGHLEQLNRFFSFEISFSPFSFYSYSKESKAMLFLVTFLNRAGFSLLFSYKTCMDQTTITHFILKIRRWYRSPSLVSVTLTQQ